ncbi:unnamed protein product [Aspergillus oryzae]|nr:unnamed protein product [Aspergillus oryzae]
MAVAGPNNLKNNPIPDSSTGSASIDTVDPLVDFEVIMSKATVTDSVSTVNDVAQLPKLSQRYADESYKLFSKVSVADPTPEEAIKIRNKCLWRVLPFLCIGASLSPNGWLSILSCGKDYQFSYFLIGASTDLIRGGITILHIPCNSFATLFVVRFLLGVAEASIVPAFLLILSMFFTYQEQAVLMPIMWSIGNASPITSGLLSYGVLWIKTGTFAPWKWFMGMSLVGEAKNRARHLSIHSHHWWSDSDVWVGSVALLP